MSPAKPLDVVVLQKDQDYDADDSWEPYQEYGEKMKTFSNDWSCYILAKEGELFSVRCANTTKTVLAVRISVDACHVQQYLLRPKREEGNEITCHGTGSHSMVFHLVSALVRAGNKHSRPPSETGCINVTVYQPSSNGTGLPPPDKPTEQLELPVSMDGTFWKLCVRLIGSGMVIGEPSPHAAEIGGMGWRRFASLSFNYRTKDELFNGRIRGIAPTQGSPFDTSTISSAEKRKRDSIGYSSSRKRRERPAVGTFWEGPSRSASPSASSRPERSTDVVRQTIGNRRPVSRRSIESLAESLSFDRSSPVSLGPRLPRRNGYATIPPHDETAVTDPEDSPSRLIYLPPGSLQADELAVPLDPLQDSASQPSTESSPRSPSTAHVAESTTEVASPAANPTELLPPSPPPPQPQPQDSVITSTIALLSTPHDDTELEKSTTESIDEADDTAAALAAFLDEASPFKPLGLSTRDLQEAGISTLAELKIIARKPELFRTKVSVLADLYERDQYLWFMLRTGLMKLQEGDHREESTDDPILKSDPVEQFVCSLSGGECIDSEALVNGLKGAGISSEKDLLVLSRNLEKYTENIPFLQEFAISKKFGWMIFQVGLEGLLGQTVSTSIQTQDCRAGGEGRAYIKWFLDTIDPDKPLGHLADGFIKAGLDDRIPLLHVAKNIRVAVDAMGFLRDLASEDQLVWAMILVGLDNLVKST